MAITYNTKTLSGDRVSNGIQMSDGKFFVSGGPSRQDRILCHGTDKNIANYLTVNVGSKDNLWFLRPSLETPSTEQELVLVHEYAHGSGSKRWPSFWINWDNAGPIQKLIEESRGSGSGADTYSLVIAPIGWADNIAMQFVNERDYGSQTIAYNPDFKPQPQEYYEEEIVDDEEEVIVDDDQPVEFNENNPIHVAMREKGLI